MAIDRDPLIDKAADLMGGWDVLATRLGLTRQALQQWREIPPRRVKAIERITGIPRHELRPDLWDRPDDEAASSRPLAGAGE